MVRSASTLGEVFFMPSDEEIFTPLRFTCSKRGVNDYSN